jgi:hypothetical protein
MRGSRHVRSVTPKHGKNAAKTSLDAGSVPEQHRSIGTIYGAQDGAVVYRS